MIPLPIPTTNQAVLGWAARTPDRTAVMARGQAYSWAALASHVALARQALATAGLAPGQIVALHCPNRYLALVLVLAVEALGAIHATLASADLVPDHPAVRHAQLLAVTNPPPALVAAPRLLRLDQAWLAASFASPADLSVLERAAVPAEGVRLGWTSGTTGTPKFMLNTRGQVSAILRHFDAVCRPVTPDHICLSFYPLTVRGMYLDVMRALQEGNLVFMVEDGSGDFGTAGRPDRAYALLLPREGEMLARACAQAGRFLNLYYIDVIGSMLAPAMLGLLHRTLTPHVFSVYSSNETNSVALSGPDGLSRVVPACAVMLVDARGQPVPPGAVGQVRVRSPRVVDGYLWDPALTACHFQDGWFLMSDLASMPEPGVLRLLGRVDDMLNIGGRKLAPYPREQRLKALPGVTDALLLQRNNALAQGELVLLLEGPSLADAQALLPLVAQALGDDIEPYVLHFTPALPRTPTGKPQREEALRRLG